VEEGRKAGLWEMKHLQRKIGPKKETAPVGGLNNYFHIQTRKLLKQGDEKRRTTSEAWRPIKGRRDARSLPCFRLVHSDLGKKGRPIRGAPSPMP
jgi:hypothetical protein